ncbi:hypothetical protein COB64_02860 [Candidatus Wolfebacteria bacterium]|nr:MAG: hypothetical protein COB64_02860 [Candidatus Wolfebacteria bacterium]
MYILFDIGGTTTRIASSDDGLTFNDPIIDETPQNFEEGMDLVKNIISTLTHDKKITSIAGGITGVLDKDGKKLVTSPHLSQWVGKPLHEILNKIIGAPVSIKNDTAMVGLGEAVAGGGKNHNIVVYVTVSTGIGGVRIVNGNIDISHFGFEPGHHIVDIENMKSLEDIVSGSAIQKKTGKHPGTIDDDEFWDKKAQQFAVGLHNIIVHWSPDIVVLGGALMIKKPGIDVKQVEKYLKGIMKIFPEIPIIKEAELGHIGGIHGSLEYLKQQKK